MSLKVMTIVGTRPEIIKLSCVMHELEEHVNHVLVHTGQNYDYELNEIFFEELKVRKPDHFLDSVGDTLAQTIGNIIAKSDKVMEEENPDAVLLYGDTNSCLSVIPAKRRKVPIFHMEAGNRSFDQRVPEELNRKIVDHLSDINMPLTEHARRYLLSEGLKPETVIKTGSPMREVLNHYIADIKKSDAVERLGLKGQHYFVVSTHREENVDSEANFRDLLDSLNSIAARYEMPVVVSTHPRTRKQLESLQEEIQLDSRIQFLKPLGLLDYVSLQMQSFCVVSDSGTISEESSILSFPAVTIRQTHERPEGMDEGVLIMCGLKSKRVLEAIDVVTQQFDPIHRAFRMVEDYQQENVSKKVVRIILSYVDYVNRTVWHRDV